MVAEAVARGPVCDIGIDPVPEQGKVFFLVPVQKAGEPSWRRQRPPLGCPIDTDLHKE